MIWGYKHRDPAIRSRARDQAAWLVRDHGDEAEAVLEGKMRRPNLSRDDRYRFKLTMAELRKLRAQGGRKRTRRGAGGRHGKGRKPPGILGRLLSALFRRSEPR